MVIKFYHQYYIGDIKVDITKFALIYILIYNNWDRDLRYKYNKIFYNDETSI